MKPEAPGSAVSTYRPEFRAAFERLNRAWLEAHALLEEADLEYLRDPEGRILATGGQVFFALEAGEVVGSCAAIRVSAEVFELAKLVVSPEAQGRGIGRRLSETAVLHARNAGASEVVLTSNTALVAAIRLYESMGFRHEPMPRDVRYLTANVFMRLIL